MGSMEERIESESRSVIRITNDRLVCRDCLYKLDDSEVFRNTSLCRVFSHSPGKPNEVLLGEDCQYYKKK
jgi:hypothetical protein